MLTRSKSEVLMLNSFTADRELVNLTPKHLYEQYAGTLTDKKECFDLRNAIIRYFVPSINGPVPAAQKRRPLSESDIVAGLQFLAQIPLETLSHAPDLALKVLTQSECSDIQKERVRRNLRSLVDWAVERDYLMPPNNPIPADLCRDIQVGKYTNLPLKRATVRQIVEEYLSDPMTTKDQTDTQNGIVRFFVPGCGGPQPLHKPARPAEVQAALTYLETVPVEYLDAALEIVTRVMRILAISQTQRTRVRNAIRSLRQWARTGQYLPQPHSVTPWGEPCQPAPELRVIQLAEEPSKTLLTYYEHYCQHGDLAPSALAPFKSTLVRYFVPACGGPRPVGKKATQAEVQAALQYLSTLSVHHLLRANELLSTEFEGQSLSLPQQHSIHSHVQRWQHWVRPDSSQSQTPAQSPALDLFCPAKKAAVTSKSGAQLQAQRSPTYALCAKQFAEDYINPQLQQQLQDYAVWRQQHNVSKGSYTVEIEQILQVLGWLHRYEDVPLDCLSFEQLITPSPLIFLARDYPDYTEYLRQKEIGIQQARTNADTDLARVQRYLDFVGGHPKSQTRRVFIALVMAKFIYRHILHTDDFPDDRDIPILRRLLDLQVQKKKQGKQTLQTVAYSETSVSWTEVIQVVEHQRRLADQMVTYPKASNAQGFSICQRSDSAIANDLQRFLSIAFCLLVPLRSRTFYELRLDETFKEGILTERRFLSIADLKSQGLWETHQDQVRFYIHHRPEDYKIGKSMALSMQESEGWWAEMPNLAFEGYCLYDYIRRWLTWGRDTKGSVAHNFFFRSCDSTASLNSGAWNNRIKTLIAARTGIKVPPRNLRKIFVSQFPEHSESVAILLQHSEQIQGTDYDMRNTVKKIEPAMLANQQFIKSVLSGAHTTDELGRVIQAPQN